MITVVGVLAPTAIMGSRHKAGNDGS